MVKTPPSNAGGEGSIPGWGAKIPHASQPKNQNRKQRQYCNKFKFNKDFKNGLHFLKILKKNKIKFQILKTYGFSHFFLLISLASWLVILLNFSKQTFNFSYFLHCVSVFCSLISAPVFIVSFLLFFLRFNFLSFYS